MTYIPPLQISEDEDYLAAFQATGCPATITHDASGAFLTEWEVNLGYWKRKGEAKALADMLSYCKLVSNGLASGRQTFICCGSQQPCTVDCFEQSSLTGVCAAAAAALCAM